MIEATLPLVLAAAFLLGSPGPVPMSLAALGATFGIRRGLAFLCGTLVGLIGVIGITALGFSLTLSLLDKSSWLVQLLGFLFVLYITHVMIGALASWAFNVTWIRRLILRQDYVEGYWLVDNRIDDVVVSIGFMHYQIVDEQLEISGAHFSPTDETDTPKKIANTTSIAADCFDGEYFNHFEIPGRGRGVASGTFSSREHSSRIPDSFHVQVIIATPPDRVFEWGQNAPDWISAGDNKGFTFLPENKKGEIISSMALGRVVTMHQHGLRLAKKDFYAAKKAHPRNYQRILAKEHYARLKANTI